MAHLTTLVIAGVAQESRTINLPPCSEWPLEVAPLPPCTLTVTRARECRRFGSAQPSIGDKSLLLFQGEWAAQCLYDFLINWTYSGASAQDVPRLYSATIFEHASLATAKVCVYVEQ